METRVFREAQQGMPVIDGIVTDESDSMGHGSDRGDGRDC